MEKDDPLPRTKLFYLDYGLQYFIESQQIHDATYIWVNDQVIWVYKLMQRERDPKPQIVEIHRMFIPSLTKTKIGYFSLVDLKEKLKAYLPEVDSYGDFFCDKIYVVKRLKCLLRCQLGMPKSELPRKQIYVLANLEKGLTTNSQKDYSLSIEEIVAQSTPGTGIYPQCVITFGKFILNPVEQWHISRPFEIVYYQKGVGLIMLF